MKKILYSAIFLAFAFFSTANAQVEARKQNSKDLAVLAYAKIQKNPPAIQIYWENSVDEKQYEIYRKYKNDLQWQLIAKLDSGTTSFKDTNVELGKAYEYQILRNSLMLKKTGDSSSAYMPYYATTYLYVGLDAPPPYYGKVLLIVEENLSYEISDKINRLIDDMKAEGWETAIRYVSRTETFDGEAVKAVKNIIKEEAAKDPYNLTSVLLLGRIAVPYSGDFKAQQGSYYPPDGHPNHAGAWPADVYYGILNDYIFTDQYVSNEIGSREENRNVPGDGKFDLTSYRNANVSLAVGRVDLYNMPAFYDEEKGEFTETQLIARYLDKDHNFRTGAVAYRNMGKIYDGFSTMPEAFASSGWRNFALFFTPDSLKVENWIRQSDSIPVLWAYGCAGGHYTGFGGGSTEDFAKNQINAVFTMMFGSYFGDWDHQDAYLRAPLASAPMALTCCWSGRPHWYLHRMPLGETIGQATILNENNYTTYIPNLYFNPQSQSWYIYAFGSKLVHIALMGDPTLRMYPGTVKPPTNLDAKIVEGDKVLLTWNAPEGESELKYFVYRGINRDVIARKKERTQEEIPPQYVLLTPNGTSETEFVDSTTDLGTVYYKVFSAKLKETIGSGSFYFPGGFAKTSIVFSDVERRNELAFDASISPNPVRERAKIDLTLNRAGVLRAEIFDARGELVSVLADEYSSAGRKTLVWDALSRDGYKAAPGLYALKVSLGGEFLVKKFILLP